MLPPEPVQVNLKVVVTVGVTGKRLLFKSLFPAQTIFVSPERTLAVQEFAFVEVHLKSADCPLFIDKEELTKFKVGAFGKLICKTTFFEVLPTGLEQAKVNVVVEVGVTAKLPATGFVPAQFKLLVENIPLVPTQFNPGEAGTFQVNIELC